MDDQKQNAQPQQPETNAVQPAPDIDASQFFQKDLTDDVAPSKFNLLARFGTKNVLMTGLLLGLLLLGTGMIVAGAVLDNNDPDTAQLEEVTEWGYDESLPEENQVIPDDPDSESAPTDEEINPEVSVETQTDEYYNEAEADLPIADDIETIPPDELPPALQTKTYTISYTNQCYAPADLTISMGEAIKFVNISSKNMWPASNEHPSHLLYPEFDSTGTIAKGDSYTFTFDKVGVWGYHDHLKPRCGGTITVK